MGCGLADDDDLLEEEGCEADPRSQHEQLKDAAGTGAHASASLQALGSSAWGVPSPSGPASCHKCKTARAVVSQGRNPKLTTRHGHNLSGNLHLHACLLQVVVRMSEPMCADCLDRSVMTKVRCCRAAALGLPQAPASVKRHVYMHAFFRCACSRSRGCCRQARAWRWLFPEVRRGITALGRCSTCVCSALSSSFAKCLELMLIWGQPINPKTLVLRQAEPWGCPHEPAHELTRNKRGTWKPSSHKGTLAMNSLKGAL